VLVPFAGARKSRKDDGGPQKKIEEWGNFLVLPLPPLTRSNQKIRTDH